MKESRNYLKVFLRLCWSRDKMDDETFFRIYGDDDASVQWLDALGEDLLNEEDMEASIQQMKIESAFLSRGELPTDKKSFKASWYCYLYDMVMMDVMVESAKDVYWKMINFDQPNWIISEIKVIDEILEIYRMNLVTQTPEFLSYVDEPSFELLMAANGMDI